MRIHSSAVAALVLAVASPAQEYVPTATQVVGRFVLRPLSPVKIDAKAAFLDEIIVKFREGLTVRLQNDRLRDLAAGVSLTALEASLEGLKPEPLFEQAVELLDSWRKQGTAGISEDQAPLADLNNYFVVHTHGREQSERILDALLERSEIETAYPALRPILHGDLIPWTPQFRDQQDYLDPAPNGVGFHQVESVVGARFHGGRIAHVEGDWTLGHEDLPKLTASSFLLPPNTFNGWAPHGDACLGILVGERNGYGVEGFASAADALYVSAVGQSKLGGLTYVSGATAMLNAAAKLRPGDVMSSSFGWLIPNSLVHAPADWPQECFDAIRVITAYGIHYVISAGNSDTSLDDAIYGGRYLSTAPVSGAIIVGASDGPKLAKSPSSNYGSRVDANGWGYGVVTLGNNGDLFWPNFDPKQTYTQSFAGTSAATPIVAGVVAALVRATEEQNGVRLTPAQVRADLRATGTKIPGNTPIGNRPDMWALFWKNGMPGSHLTEQHGSVGGRFVSRVFGQPNEIYVLLMSGARARIPLGLNRPLLVDPNFLAQRAGLIGASSWADVSQNVPNDKSLANAAIFTQGFVFRPTGLHATGSCEVWIQPQPEIGPDAPTNLEVTNRGKDFAEIRWIDRATNEKGYIIRIAEPWQNYVEVGRTGPGATTFRIGNLTALTDYWVRVSAYNDAGESPYAEVFLQTKEANVPDAPTDLAVTRALYQNITLAWKDRSDNEDGFRIAMSLDGINWDNVGETLSNVESFVVKDLEPGKRHWFRVRAYKDTKVERLFSGYTLTVTGDTILTKPVKDVTVTKAQPFKVLISWTDGSTDEDGFRLQKRQLPNGAWVAAGLAPAIDLPNTTGNAEITELLPDTDYEVRVLAYKTFTYKNNTERYFDDVNAPVRATRTRSAKPETPDSLAVSNPRLQGLDVCWQDRSEIEDEYEIFYSLDQGVNWEPKPIATLAGTNTAAPVCKDLKGLLLPGTGYRFRVRASKVWGGDPKQEVYYSDWSNVADGTTTVPAKVQSITTVSVAPFKVRIQFVDAADNEDGFRIQVGSTASGPWTAIDIYDQPLAGTGLSVIMPIDNLQPNRTYYFRALAFKAVSGKRYWDESAPVTRADTRDPRPATPTGLAISQPTLKGMTVCWMDNSLIEDGYNVSVSVDNGANWDRKAVVKGTATTGAMCVTLKDVLLPDTTYLFRVRATKVWEGDPETTYYSSYTPAKSGRTLSPAPAAPSALEHTALSAASITLRWTDNATNESAFATYRSTTSAAGPWTGTGTAAAVSGSGGKQTKQIDNLTPDTRYWFASQAYRDFEGKRYYSTLAVIERTTPTAVPPAPSNVVAVPVSDTEVNVTWTDNSKAEEKFAIYYGPGSGGPWTLLGTHAAVDGTGSRPSKTFGGLARNTTYWVTAQAIRNLNNQEYHSLLAPAVSVRTYDRLSNAPTNLSNTAAIGKRYITINWDDNSLNETEFRIQFRKSGTTNWTQYTPPRSASAGTGRIRYQIDGLEPNTSYDFRVRVYCATAAPPGFTAWTNVHTARTNP
ncbi:MAG: fibronectin type III domain-containing protein [Planctomycetes bacterium]|nr:fibronectin type III domain-containing protein [Planctomycetota bacterium]MCB9917309.1 fibronectin type III domain-containing protein [Planctomycetota bacterium]